MRRVLRDDKEGDVLQRRAIEDDRWGIHPVFGGLSELVQRKKIKKSLGYKSMISNRKELGLPF